MGDATEAHRKDFPEIYSDTVDLDEERHHELYSTFQPPSAAIEHQTPALRADPTFQAFCQLVAFRLDVARALVILADKQRLYVIGDATQESALESESLAIDPGHHALTLKHGSVIDCTLSCGQPHALRPTLRPYHEIHFPSEDLVKELAFLGDEWSSIRYFSGVPIKSSGGISIGVMIAVDQRPRYGLGSDGIQAFSTLAQNVASHLQSLQVSREYCRARCMQECMAQFRTSDKHSRRRRPNAQSRPPLARTNQGGIIIEGSGKSSEEHQVADPFVQTSCDVGLDTPRAEEATTHFESPLQDNIVTNTEYQLAFDKTTSLLRKALDVGAGGGVVLLDTVALNGGKSTTLSEPEDTQTISATKSTSPQEILDPRLKLPKTREKLWSPRREISNDLLMERAILASASRLQDDSTVESFGRADPTFAVTLTARELLSLCQRHPTGKLYDIPATMPVSMHDRDGHNIASALSFKQSILVLLKRQFRNARQVIFIPMLLPNSNRWSCVFAYTSSPFRRLSYGLDFLPALAFCDTVKLEMIRLTHGHTFGSGSKPFGPVSHEVRSPLHGLLASVALLQDTKCDTVQAACVNTIDACARTLYDTISMILEFEDHNALDHSTSINPMERDRARHDTIERSLSDFLMFEDVTCDVALMAEEVVDALASAHQTRYRERVYKDLETTTRSDSSEVLQKRPWLRRILNPLRLDVELTLDVVHTTGWHYRASPGAIRRVIMNIFGNALKYTKSGVITISVGLESSPHPQEEFASEAGRENIIIMVTDTGDGISPQFMGERLFAPFAQENPQSSGSGLGLHVLKIIVDQLGGRVDVRSVLNVGTSVTVVLPLEFSRVNSPKLSDSRSKHLPSHLSDSDIVALRTLPYPPTILLYSPADGLSGRGKTAETSPTQRSLLLYLIDWFQLPTTRSCSLDGPAQILIADESHLPHLLYQQPNILDLDYRRQSIIILCSCPTRQALMAKDIMSDQVELLTKPFGPHKLARAVCRALENAAKPRTAPTVVQVVAPRTRLSPTLRACQPRQHDNRGEMEPLKFSHVPPRGGSGHRHEAIKVIRTASQGPTGVINQNTPREFPFPPISTPSASWPSVQRLATASEIGSQQIPEVSSPDDPSSCSIGSPESDLDLTTQIIRSLSMTALSALNEPGAITPSRLSIERDDHSLAADSPLSASGVASPAETGRGNLSARARRGAPRSGPAIEAVAPKPRPRLLLVDDNKLNLEVLRNFAKKRGYGPETCRTAENGLQAVGVCKEFTPDMIIMDLSMPVMDGLEATRRIRTLEAEAPERFDSIRKRAFIIALTGNSSSTDEPRALSMGVDIYMTKPCNFKEIGRLLAEWQPAS